MATQSYLRSLLDVANTPGFEVSTPEDRAKAVESILQQEPTFDTRRKETLTEAVAAEPAPAPETDTFPTDVVPEPEAPLAPPVDSSVRVGAIFGRKLLDDIAESRDAPPAFRDIKRRNAKLTGLQLGAADVWRMTGDKEKVAQYVANYRAELDSEFPDLTERQNKLTQFFEETKADDSKATTGVSTLEGLARTAGVFGSMRLVERDIKNLWKGYTDITGDPAPKVEQVEDIMSSAGGAGRVLQPARPTPKAFDKAAESFAKKYGMSKDDVKDFIKHRVDGFDGDVSRDAFGTVHFKQNVVLNGVDAMRDALQRSDIPERVKDAELEKLPQRYKDLQAGVVNNFLRNHRDVAERSGIARLVRVDKDVDTAFEVLRTLASDRAGATAALSMAGGLLKSVGGLGELTDVPSGSGLESPEEREAARSRRNRGITQASQEMLSQVDLGDIFYAERNKVFGVPAAVLGQVGASVVESLVIGGTLGRAAVSGVRALPWYRAAGPVTRRAVDGLVASGTVGNVFGIREGNEMWKHAQEAGFSDAESAQMALSAYAIESVVTTVFGGLGLSGIEGIAAGIRRGTLKQSIADTVKQLRLAGTKQFGRIALGELVEETLIEALHMAVNQTKLNPDMTVDEFKENLKNVAVATLVATGPLAANSGLAVRREAKKLAEDIRVPDLTTEELESMANARTTGALDPQQDAQMDEAQREMLSKFPQFRPGYTFSESADNVIDVGTVLPNGTVVTVTDADGNTKSLTRFPDGFAENDSVEDKLSSYTVIKQGATIESIPGLEMEPEAAPAQEGDILDSEALEALPDDSVIRVKDDTDPNGFVDLRKDGLGWFDRFGKQVAPPETATLLTPQNNALQQQNEDEKRIRQERIEKIEKQIADVGLERVSPEERGFLSALIANVTEDTDIDLEFSPPTKTSIDAFNKQAAARAAGPDVTQSPATGTTPTESLVEETNESIYARTAPGPERDAAIAARRKAAIAKVDSLKKGDVILDEDGFEYTIDSVFPGTGKVFLKGQGEPIDLAAGFVPAGRKADGTPAHLIQYTVKPSPPKQGTTPTESLPEGQPPTSGDVGVQSPAPVGAIGDTADGRVVRRNDDGTWSENGEAAFKNDFEALQAGVKLRSVDQQPAAVRDPAKVAFQMDDTDSTYLSPASLVRHADLEAKHNAGTITPEETAEAERMVEKRARAAGWDTSWPLWRGDKNIWFIPNRPVYLTPDLFVANKFKNFGVKSRRSRNAEESAVVRKFYVRDGLRLADKNSIINGKKLGSTSFLHEPSLRDDGITADDLIQQGYDGAIGLMDSTISGGEAEVVILNPNQIKSADPFTGVPLAQRFDITSPDIRFQPDTPFEPAVENPDKYLGFKGAAVYLGASRMVIELNRVKADLETVLHEVAHFAIRAFIRTKNNKVLTNAEIAAVEKALGVENGEMDYATEEALVDQAIAYFAQNLAPKNSALAKAFAKIAEWFTRTIGSTTGTTYYQQLDPAIKEAFDKIFTRSSKKAQKMTNPVGVAPVYTSTQHSMAMFWRDVVGMPGVPKRLSMSDAEAVEQAKPRLDALKKDPTGEYSVVNKILNNPDYVPSKVENVVLAAEIGMSFRALQEARKQFNSLQSTDTVQRATELKDALEKQTLAFESAINASELAGSRAGLALQARKHFVLVEMSEQAIYTRLLVEAKRKLPQGKELPATRRKKLQAKAKELADEAETLLKRKKEVEDSLEQAEDEEVEMSLIDKLKAEVDAEIADKQAKAKEARKANTRDVGKRAAVGVRERLNLRVRNALDRLRGVGPDVRFQMDDAESETSAIPDEILKENGGINVSGVRGRKTFAGNTLTSSQAIQRGFPENFATIQSIAKKQSKGFSKIFSYGTGTYFSGFEHLGDLYHRVAKDGEFGAIKSKIETHLLRYFENNRLPLEKQIDEDIIGNTIFNEGLTLDEIRKAGGYAEIVKTPSIAEKVNLAKKYNQLAGLMYAAMYAQLKAYTPAQAVARNIAIAYGLGRYQLAKSLGEKLLQYESATSGIENRNELGFNLDGIGNIKGRTNNETRKKWEDLLKVGENVSDQNIEQVVNSIKSALYADIPHEVLRIDLVVPDPRFQTTSPDIRFQPDTPLTPELITEDLAYAAIDAISNGTVNSLKEFKAYVKKEFGENLLQFTDNAFAQAQEMIKEEIHTARIKKTAEQLVKEVDPEKGLGQRYIWNLARAVIEEMGISGKDVLDQVTSMLKQEFPDVTREDVANAFTSYGKVTYPSGEDIEKELRKLRRLELIGLQLDDLRRGQMSKKTGPQRDPSSPEERLLTKERQNLMKQLKLSQGGDATMRSSLDTAKKRLRNMMEEMELAIKREERIPENARTPQTDAELEGLRAQYAEVKKRYDAAFKQEPDLEKRVEKAMKLLDEMIAEEEDMAAKGIVRRVRENKPPLEDPRLTERREKLKGLRDARRELAAARAPKRSPEDVWNSRMVAAMQKSIDKLNEIVTSGVLPETGQRGLKYSPSAELQQLITMRDNLAEYVEEMRKVKRKLTAKSEYEKAEIRAMKAAKKTLDKINARIASSDFSKQVRQPGLADTSPSVVAIRALVKEAKTTFNEMRKAQRPVKTADEIYNERAIAAAKKRMEKLNEMLRTKNFIKPPKPDPQLSQELLQIRYDEQKLKEKVRQAQVEAGWESMDTIDKTWRVFRGALNLRKLTALGGEPGGFRRQAALYTNKGFVDSVLGMRFILTGNWKRLAENQHVFVNFFKAIKAGVDFSEAAEADIYRQLTEGERGQIDRLRGIKYHSPFDEGFLGKEDIPDPEYARIIEEKWTKYGSKLIGERPAQYLNPFALILAFERFNRVYFNLARSHMSDAITEVSLVNPGMSPSSFTDQQQRAIGHAVNVATGRWGTKGADADGMRKGLEASIPFLNEVFTISARWNMSRISMLTLGPLTTRGLTGRQRLGIAREIYLKPLMGGLFYKYIINLAYQALAEAEDDEEERKRLMPKFSTQLFAPDFMSMQVGDMSVDMSAGLRPYYAIMALMSSATIRPGPDGSVRGYYNKNGDWVHVSNAMFRVRVIKFVEGRMNVNAGYIWRTFGVKEYFGGKEVTAKSAFDEFVANAITRESMELYKEGGPQSALGFLQLFFGDNVNIYNVEEREKEVRPPKPAKLPF